MFCILFAKVFSAFHKMLSGFALMKNAFFTSKTWHDNFCMKRSFIHLKKRGFNEDMSKSKVVLRNRSALTPCLL